MRLQQLHQHGGTLIAVNVNTETNDTANGVDTNEADTTVQSLSQMVNDLYNDALNDRVADMCDTHIRDGNSDDDNIDIYHHTHAVIRNDDDEYNVYDSILNTVGALKFSIDGDCISAEFNKLQINQVLQHTANT